MESTPTDKGDEFTELKETEEERKLRTKVRLEHSACLQPCSGRGGSCLLPCLRWAPESKLLKPIFAAPESKLLAH